MFQGYPTTEESRLGNKIAGVKTPDRFLVPCGSFPRMSDLTIEVDTTKSSMEEIRPSLDAGLKEAFPGGMLKWHWEGDVMHLSGPGAQATIVLENDRLVGRAHLKPPASLMKPVIEQKIANVMKKAALV
jgi:hypothetical protein